MTSAHVTATPYSNTSPDANISYLGDERSKDVLKPLYEQRLDRNSSGIHRTHSQVDQLFSFYSPTACPIEAITAGRHGNNLVTLESQSGAFTSPKCFPPPAPPLPPSAHIYSLNRSRFHLQYITAFELKHLYTTRELLIPLLHQRSLDSF